MTVTGSNFIAGAPSRAGSQTFTSVDPRTRTPGAVPFYNATPEEIDRATQAAAATFAETRHYPAQRLAGFLDRVAGEIEALGDALLETADMETALGLARLTGERARTTGQLRQFGNLLREGSYVDAIIDTALPDRQPAPRPSIRRMLFPIGPVAVFSASNFPFAFSVAGGDTASAFAAGCPVVVKAHPGHPATSELFASAINRAVKAERFPAGFFSLLQGDGVEVGQALVQHPAIEAVAFTGSLRAGRAIFDTAAQRPKPIPVYAEMGSVNPVVLLPGAIEARGAEIAEGAGELRHPGGRPVLHQPRPDLHARRAGRAALHRRREGAHGGARTGDAAQRQRRARAGAGGRGDAPEPGGAARDRRRGCGGRGLLLRQHPAAHDRGRLPRGRAPADRALRAGDAVRGV
ncbi:MAG: aldehyde dehydrogenase family protein [Anaerolineae bacterium]|nr:aldehyde dehydrogenase family protein [Anaerolineae bacterium]